MLKTWYKDDIFLILFTSSAMQTAWALYFGKNHNQKTGCISVLHHISLHGSWSDNSGLNKYKCFLSYREGDGEGMVLRECRQGEEWACWLYRD